ncbi:NAD(P)/FAD-dependent oxidoreductase [Sphingomonas nostoxanthinifaciens]|uniref:NAD(P)/FAD-dependent oxidoreductase n=1 Tax=Sphingomonas nostoxanthinifaciens TaxID=2872652 RepID=UPI001CC1CFF5|nr:NAD(P)-binding protein [Sphingomonas nostoxanthinifaciens]UAK25915.1 NAD(P)-binding protein [Sphingomonas nostoxanthinifaciens]
MKEAIIVGGGLAGGAAATLLAQAGRPVLLLEREAEPVDKVCGEFLSIEAQHHLARLGLDLDHLGATRIGTLRVAFGRRTVETPLPFVARGLTRKRLDSALLDRAANAGARIERGFTVRSIAPGRIDTSRGELRSDLLLLASGKHEVRGAGRDVAGCDAGYVGFKTYWRLPRRARTGLDGQIDVILFDGGYAGLQMVEGEVANLCLLIEKSRLAALGGNWAGVLDALLREPHAAALLGDAEQCSPKPLTIAGVPYGFLHRADPAETAFRLGDQAAVIPSFCGEGMAIALHSAAVAAAVIGEGARAADHHAILRRDFQRRLRLSIALQRAGQKTWSRELVLKTLRLWPGVAKHIIALTRIPSDPTDGRHHGLSPRR